MRTFFQLDKRKINQTEDCNLDDGLDESAESENKLCLGSSERKQ